MKRNALRVFRALVVGCAMLCSAHATYAQATAQAPTLPAASTVAAHVTINGHRVDYHAIAEEAPLNDSTGTMFATLFSTSYVVTSPKDIQRPVMFLFNGGPGSASEGVHRSFGPRTIVSAPPDRGGDSVAITVENPDSPLDVADLVFIDPVGTGYSRLLDPDHKGDVWGVVSDARVTANFIREWLRRHGRVGAPIVIAGESYGGTRMVLAAEMLTQSEPREVNLRGLIMISPSTNTGTHTRADTNEARINSIPDFAAVARFHGRGGLTTLPVAEVAAQAERFAETDYRRALEAGDTLSPQHRDSVADEIVRLTGLPKAFVQEKNLRITPQNFVMTLLSDVGERTGLEDGRAHAPLAITSKRKPPYDDPATSPYTMKYNLTGAMEHYFRSELAYTPVPGAEYVRLAMPAHNAWSHAVPPEMANSAHMLQDIVRRVPSLHIMLTVGYYDLTIPYRNPVKTLQAMSLPPGVLEVKIYPTGHAVHSDLSERPVSLGDVRHFIEAIASTP